jgi:tetratricopeptide (TPR) repeat protein
MRYFILVVIIVIFSGCGSFKKNVNQGKEKSEQKLKEVVLNDEQQRKFNYYFFEGNRQKALNESNKSFMYFAEALKIDSTCSACAYELSRLLLSSENLKEAEELMTRAVRYSPRNKFYINLYSRILQANGNGKKAVDVSETILDLEDANVDDLYFVAQIKMQNELYDEAVQVLNIIEKQIGINENLVFEKVQLYLENDEFNKAEDEISFLVKKFPGNSDFKIVLGDFYLEHGDLKDAYQQYHQVYSKEPKNGKVQFSLANYYLEKTDTTRFKEYLMKGFSSENVDLENKLRRFVPFISGKDISDNPLNKENLLNIFELLVEKHPYRPEVYAAYAEFLKSEEDTDAAMGILEKSLELDASQPEIWQEYLFLISSQDDNELFLEKSSEAVTFFPEIPLFRLFHGVSLFQTDKVEDAVKTLEKGLTNVGENAGLKQRFHAYLGDFYHSLDSLSKAFKHYESALKIDENDPMVLNNYSYYLSVEGKELDKAERMSARTIELEPGNATFLDTYAWILFKRGQFSEAKFIIERAIDNMEEPSGVIVEHYGDILFENGDTQGAVDQWKKALELEGHSDVLKQKIQENRYIDEQE